MRWERRSRPPWLLAPAATRVIAVVAVTVLVADLIVLAARAVPEPAPAAPGAALAAPPTEPDRGVVDGWEARPEALDLASLEVAERPRADAQEEEAVAPPPPAPVPAADEPAETIAERGAAALARIDYPWEQLGFEIHFLGPRRGVRGMTFPEERRIELYVRLADPLDRTAHDLAHEIGHAADIAHMDEDRRSQWMDRRGIDRSRSWWPCSRCEDRTHGSGDYAEVFALWQVGPRYFSSQVAPKPTAEELAELVPYFRPAPDEPDEPDDEDERDPLVPCMVSCR